MFLASQLLTFLSGKDVSLVLKHIFEENVFLQRKRQQQVKSSKAITHRLEKDGSAPPGSALGLMLSVSLTPPCSLADVSGTLIPLCQTNHTHTLHLCSSRPTISFPIYQEPILCHIIMNWFCKFFRGKVGMELRGPSEPSQKFFLTLTFWREAGSFRFRYSLFTHFMEQNMELIGGPRALYRVLL